MREWAYARNERREEAGEVGEQVRIFKQLAREALRRAKTVPAHGEEVVVNMVGGELRVRCCRCVQP